MKSALKKIKKQTSDLSILSKKMEAINFNRQNAQDELKTKASKFINEEFRSRFGDSIQLNFSIYFLNRENYIRVDSVGDFYKSEQGTWFTSKKTSFPYKFYETTITESKLPIKERDLNKFFRFVESKTGLPVKLYKRLILGKKNITSINSGDDIIVKYGVDLLDEGKIWYQGWEIDDQFYICWDKHDKSYRLFYTDDGHGFGRIIEVDKTSASLSKFFEVIGKDGQNEEVIKKHQHKIYKNWKFA